VSDRTPPADDPPWLSADELAAWMSLIGVLMALPQALDAQLKRDSGLNFFEYSILVALSGSAGRAMQLSNLAQLTGGSLSRLSHAITRLERQGWVQRRVHDGQTRCTEAVLTDAGLAVLSAAAPGHVREVRRVVFDALTSEQVSQLEWIGRGVLRQTAPATSALVDQAIEKLTRTSQATTGLPQTHAGASHTAKRTGTRKPRTAKGEVRG
jgi:DNA-binding MarR family transcriptional regulator